MAAKLVHDSQHHPHQINSQREKEVKPPIHAPGGVEVQDMQETTKIRHRHLAPKDGKDDETPTLLHPGKRKHNDDDLNTNLEVAKAGVHESPPNFDRTVQLFVMRHGQGEHNKPEGHHIRDAKLTPLGLSQAQEVGRHLTRTTFPRPPDVIFCSPLRRTVQTALGVLDLPEWKHGSTRRPNVVLLPEMQEIHNVPSDTGVEVETLFASISQLHRNHDEVKRFSTKIGVEFNTSLVTPRWYEKGSESDDQGRAKKRGATLHKKLQTLLSSPADFAKAKTVFMIAHDGILSNFLHDGHQRRLNHAEVLKCEYDIRSGQTSSRPRCEFEAFAAPHQATN